MHTLLFSTSSLPAARLLAGAARELGWQSCALDETPAPKTSGRVVFYGGTDVVLAVAKRFHLALLEPPLDLLARLPFSLRCRAVEYRRRKDLDRLLAPTFVKPADPLNKAFDAGIYRDMRQVRVPEAVDPETPVLVSEPVEWLAEYRCFVLEGAVAAASPYLSFGRPIWRPYERGGEPARVPPHVLTLCDRLVSEPGISLPPAFVVDVGLVEERGWAVVEFNPAWCSGLLGCDPRQVLPVLQRACHGRDSVPRADRRWVIREWR
jgi:ATP-grasp domain-containing protein